MTDWNDAVPREDVGVHRARLVPGDWNRHPFEEETVPDYTDFQDGRQVFVGQGAAPRRPAHAGRPAGAGARRLRAGPRAHPPLDGRGALAGLVHGRRAVGVDALHSTLGRHAARAIRAAVLSELAPKHWQLLVDNIGSGDTAIFNEPVFPRGEIRGIGVHEAPRGVLSHWAVIRNGEISNYQAVVPSTWNAGPRDEKSQLGPYEASLVGNPVADAELPLEVLRTVHSFDPCIACAIHTADPEGNEISSVSTVDFCNHG
jgi:hydrogenase large subunit